MDLGPCSAESEVEGGARKNWGWKTGFPCRKSACASKYHSNWGSTSFSSRWVSLDQQPPASRDTVLMGELGLFPLQYRGSPYLTGGWRGCQTCSGQPFEVKGRMTSFIVCKRVRYPQQDYMSSPQVLRKNMLLMYKHTQRDNIIGYDKMEMGAIFERASQRVGLFVLPPTAPLWLWLACA